MKNKILLLDVDSTILDLTRSRNYLLNKLTGLLKDDKSSVGKRIDSLLKKNTKENKIFHPHKFIKQLVDNYSIKNKNKFKNIIWAKERFEKSLYGDVIKFIKDVRVIVEIIIFSQGFREYQKRKLVGIEQFLDRKNIFIFKNKQSNLKKVFKKYKNKKIFLIDDSPLIINAAKQINKKIITILIKRKNGKKYIIKDEIMADYKVQNLKPVYKIIKFS